MTSPFDSTELGLGKTAQLPIGRWTRHEWQRPFNHIISPEDPARPMLLVFCKLYVQKSIYTRNVCSKYRS